MVPMIDDLHIPKVKISIKFHIHSADLVHTALQYIHSSYAAVRLPGVCHGLLWVTVERLSQKIYIYCMYFMKLYSCCYEKYISFFS